jgi:hypothetical protein
MYLDNSLISGPRADLLTERLPRSVEVVHDSRLGMYEAGARRWVARGSVPRHGCNLEVLEVLEVLMYP